MQKSLKKFIDGFGYAWEGVKCGFRQRNFKVHTFCAFAVIFLSLYLRVSPLEAALLFFAIGAVLGAELLNSAIEEVCNIMANKLHLDYYDTWDPRNLAAGGVFCTAVAALLIACLVFIPKLIALFI